MSHVVTQEDLDTNPFFATLGIPVGTEVEYDPAVVISREEAIARGIDVEKVERESTEFSSLSGSGTISEDGEITAGPVAKGFYSLEVEWRLGTTDGEREAAMPFIKEFSEALAESREDHFPLCIDALKVKRDR